MFNIIQYIYNLLARYRNITMYLSPAAHRIQYFTIFGERCSGTHFLQHAIQSNFHIQYVKGEKHFFGNKEFRDAIDRVSQSNELTLFESKMFEFDSIDQDELLVFAIVRDPVEWIDSFYKKPHHVPPENRTSYEHFISCEFYSIYEDGLKIKQEIMEDRHWKTKNRYQNIFELRNSKGKYMLEEMPKKYVHYYLIKYEDLRDDYINTLEHIRKRFGLRRKTEQYNQIIKYKGTYNALYEKKKVVLNETQQQHIWANLDIVQECALGYTPNGCVNSSGEFC